MKRWSIALLTLAMLGAAVVWAALWLRGQVAPPIRVGILHSRTGAMKISEESMIDAEVMALTSSSGAPGSAGRPAYPPNDLIARAGGDALALLDGRAGWDVRPDRVVSGMVTPAAARTDTASAASPR